MFYDWSPVTLAKLSLMMMFIPAGLTVLAVLVSILIAAVVDVTGIKKDSALGMTLDKAGNDIFYVAFLSIIVINITVVGLFISGVWALLRWLFAVI